MFNRVLLCYDGSATARTAMRRGAELAKLLSSQVYVLSVVPNVVPKAIFWAAAAGSISLVDPVSEAQGLVRESGEYLRRFGVEAEHICAQGNVIDEIAACAHRHSIDLIVLADYPTPSGHRWWSGSDRAALAERVNCCVLIVTTESSG